MPTAAPIRCRAHVGNALGAWLGGLAISAGLGYTAPLYVGAAIVTLGLEAETFADQGTERRVVAAVSRIAPIATLRAYPETGHPAAASETSGSRLTCGSRSAITNSVRPIPKPPSASATDPAGVPRDPPSWWMFTRTSWVSAVAPDKVPPPPGAC
ncbi:hypothetical protein GCM10010365_15740 [Streptomyces poonensis]|uniref:Uncharacterized protein n=1 Tax=Streptomyces poonensis TaxID=68255 RepID=A0A918PBI5_9ACTN|nr:hypothetical protein GCM10010365_15740 [Streptomyces poonensis]